MISSTEAERIQQLEDSMERLKILVEKNNASLAEFVELANGFKFGMKLLGWVERFSVWIAKVAVAGGLLYSAWRFVIKEAIAQVRRM